MLSTNILTLLALSCFLHAMIVLLFGKFILDHEPVIAARAVYFCLLLLLPFLGAYLIYLQLDLQWFRNEDCSPRSGAISIDILELDAVFNPGSKHIQEERQRVKVESSKEGEKYKGD